MGNTHTKQKKALKKDALLPYNKTDFDPLLVELMVQEEVSFQTVSDVVRDQLGLRTIGETQFIHLTPPFYFRMKVRDGVVNIPLSRQLQKEMPANIALEGHYPFYGDGSLCHPHKQMFIKVTIRPGKLYDPITLSEERKYIAFVSMGMKDDIRPAFAMTRSMH